MPSRAEGGEGDAPSQRALGAHDFGMGDMLGHDVARLRILLERHLLHTGSARAKALLDDWATTQAQFVKVMPRDYAKALTALRDEPVDESAIAAE